MASTGMFDAGDHAEATNRMQNAMQELQVKKEQEDLIKAEEEKRQLEQQALDLKKNIIKENVHDSTYEKAPDYSMKEDSDDDDDDDDDAFLNDPELDRLRELRLAKLKKEHAEKQENLAKGHGQYREIVQDEFLKEVTSSAYVLVHFFHHDFEKCKVIDHHLAKIAPHHSECKFLKLNAEKAPFFVEKLMIRVLPTILAFHDGIAFDERVVGFQDLTEGLPRGRESEFATSALVRKLVSIGVINIADDANDDDTLIVKKKCSTNIRSSDLNESRLDD